MKALSLLLAIFEVYAGLLCFVVAIRSPDVRCVLWSIGLATACFFGFLLFIYEVVF